MLSSLIEMSQSANNPLIGNAALSAGMKAGNINVAGATRVEVMDLSAESKESQQEHARLLKQFEASKRARTIIVPTNTEEIKKQLRELNHPITLFGEGPGDRRDRLRDVLAALELNNEELDKVQVRFPLYLCNCLLIPFLELQYIVSTSIFICV